MVLLVLFGLISLFFHSAEVVVKPKKVNLVFNDEIYLATPTLDRNKNITATENSKPISEGVLKIINKTDKPQKPAAP